MLTKNKNLKLTDFKRVVYFAFNIIALKPKI